MGAGASTPQENLLPQAAKEGNKEYVERYLAHPNCDVNATESSTGNTALHYAAAIGHEDVLIMLLGHPATQVNLENLHRTTALVLAAGNGHTRAIEYLIQDSRVDPNLVTSGGLSALHMAAQRGRLLAVRALLEHPALDVNLRTAPEVGGDTALHISSRLGKLKVVRCLLDLKPPHYLDIDKKNFHGETAVLAAQEAGQVDIVEMLLDRTQASTGGQYRSNSGVGERFDPRAGAPPPPYPAPENGHSGDRDPNEPPRALPATSPTRNNINTATANGLPPTRVSTTGDYMDLNVETFSVSDEPQMSALENVRMNHMNDPSSGQPSTSAPKIDSGYSFVKPPSGAQWREAGPDMPGMGGLASKQVPKATGAAAPAAGGTATQPPGQKRWQDSEEDPSTRGGMAASEVTDNNDRPSGFFSSMFNKYDEIKARKIQEKAEKEKKRREEAQAKAEAKEEERLRKAREADERRAREATEKAQKQEEKARQEAVARSKKEAQSQRKQDEAEKKKREAELKKAEAERKKREEQEEKLRQAENKKRNEARKENEEKARKGAEARKAQARGSSFAGTSNGNQSQQQSSQPPPERRASASSARTDLKTLWKQHETAWTTFEATPPQLITYRNIPWPLETDEVLRGMVSAAGPEKGQEDAVAKQVFRKATMRWHPDKFLAKFGARLNETEKEKILDQVKDISQSLNRAWKLKAY